MKLLCYYGFVVPANPHDLVPLLLEVRRSLGGGWPARGVGGRHWPMAASPEPARVVLIWLNARPLHPQPPAGPLKARQLAALEALELGLEHSLQDGPLSKQVRVVVVGGAMAAGMGLRAAPWHRPPERCGKFGTLER